MIFEKEAVERLRMWFENKKAPPLHIDVEPTSSCNLKCLFCWTRSEDRVKSCQYQRKLTSKRLLEIVREAAAFGVKEWEIAGGWEPMSKPEVVFKMMILIKKYGMYGSITTNGTLFTEKMIKKLVKIGWDRILFSLEGPDADTHDFLTQVKGSFEREKRNISLFKKWKERLGVKKPAYSIHSVLTNKNYDKLEQMIELGYELGCEGVNFEPLMIWSEEGKKLKLNKSQREELGIHVERALKKAKELGIHTNVVNLREEKLVNKRDMRKVIREGVNMRRKNILDSPCFSPWLNMEIRVSGRVTACRICNDETGCENIMDKSLEDIWFGEYFENLRKQFINGNLPKYCKDCASGLIVDMRRLREQLIKKVGPFGCIRRIF
ncbi:MAG: radical SAM protein [Candidatus Aenigmatarchaeota archaeon]